MNLSFKQLRISNFKSVVEAELNLDRQPGLHFIRGENQVEPRLGSNGAGKSTLFDSLCWCLFGKTPGGLRNPDIAPWGEKKPTTSVTLEFEVGVNLYTLCRTYNPGTLTLDGDECSQEEVEDLVGFNFDLFTNAIILAQGQPLFFDLQPRGKMQLFTDVLSLDKWEARAEVAKDKAEDYDRKVANAIAQVDSLKSELVTVKDMFKEYSERSAEWKSSHEMRVNALKKSHKEESARLEIIEAKYDKASVEYDMAATELKVLKESHQPLQQKYKAAERALFVEQERIKQYKRDAESIERQLARLKESSVCPTCGQTVKQANFKEHQKELLAEKADLDLLIKADIPHGFIEEYQTAGKELDNTLDAEKQYEHKAFECRQQVDYLTPELANLQSTVRHMEKSLTELEQETNPYREQVSKLEDKITILKEDIEDGEEYSAKMREKAERFRYWVKGFKDIRLFVIEEVLDELQLASKVILEEVGLIGWTIEYDVERETKSGTVQRGINISIKSPTAPSPVKWESWSGGEGQRLRLVGALALSEVLLGYAGIDTNLEILDEPTRHLSKEGVRDIWSYLAERAVRLDRVCLYIDHQSVESARFASTVTVTKDSCGIHIQEE